MAQPETLSQKVVQTRKPHRCFGCWRSFPVGSVLLSDSFTDGQGGVCTHYWCEGCWQFANEIPDLEWDALLPGEIGAWHNGVWTPLSIWRD